MRAAILTVSSSVARGETEDRSGGALAQQARDAGAEIAAQHVVADDREQIERWLRAQVREGVDLIFTTGGTGFTEDDVTPRRRRR